jgi:hypothetical protein
MPDIYFASGVRTPLSKVGAIAMSVPVYLSQCVRSCSRRVQVKASSLSSGEAKSR